MYTYIVNNIIYMGSTYYGHLKHFVFISIFDVAKYKYLQPLKSLKHHSIIVITKLKYNK